MTQPHRGGRPHLPREHGTDRDYNQHRYAHETPCDACRAAHTQAERERNNRNPARPTSRHSARLDDLAWMAATGECASGAAARLGTTTDALEQWCKRHGLTPEWQRLNAREPRDWNRAKGDAA